MHKNRGRWGGWRNHPKGPSGFFLSSTFGKLSVCGLPLACFVVTSFKDILASDHFSLCLPSLAPRPSTAAPPGPQAEKWNRSSFKSEPLAQGWMMNLSTPSHLWGSSLCRQQENNATVIRPGKLYLALDATIYWFLKIFIWEREPGRARGRQGPRQTLS